MKTFLKNRFKVKVTAKFIILKLETRKTKTTSIESNQVNPENKINKLNYKQKIQFN